MSGGQALTPVVVRSIRIGTVEETNGGMAKASIRDAYTIDAHPKGYTDNGVLVNEGVYLHRDDVCALLDGMADQLENRDNDSVSRATAERFRSMSEHVRHRGV